MTFKFNIFSLIYDKMAKKKKYSNYIYLGRSKYIRGIICLKGRYVCEFIITKIIK